MFYRKESDHAESEESIGSRELHLKLVQGLLLVVLLLSFFHLYKGPHPWSRKVMEHIEQVQPAVEKPKLLATFGGWLMSDVEHPDVLRAKEHEIIGHYWGAAFAAGAAFLLLVSAPLWMPRGQKETKDAMVADAEAEGDDENAGETGLARLLSSGPIFFVLLIGALAVGCYFRVPMLNHSLWNDEEYAMRRYAHGSYQAGDDGKKEFKAATWTDTLVENDNGNNHVLHSLLSRASLAAWHSFNNKPASEFSETALRMPSLIAALLTLVLVAVIGWECGLPWVGAGAGWLLALHPWHIRYSVEAKGYSLMLFFICLSILGMIRAHRHHRLSGWLLFAIGEAGYLCSFAGSIYVAIALNAVLFVECLVRLQPRRLGSLVGFNLLAAIPVLLLMLPSVPQLLGFMAHDQEALSIGAMGGDWLRDLASHLALGLRYANPLPEAHLGTSWFALAGASPGSMKAFAVVLSLLSVMGVVLSLFHGTGKRLAVVGIVVAGALAYFHASSQQHVNLSWYYLYLLLPLVFAAPVALSRLPAYSGIFIAAFVGFYGFASEIPRQVFMQHDRQPIRQAVAFIRDSKPEAITATFGVSDRQSQSYDPEVNLITKPEDLDKLIARGMAERRPVFVYFCGLTETAKRCPELLQRISGAPDFVSVKEVKGLEEMFSYIIYQWRVAR